MEIKVMGQCQGPWSMDNVGKDCNAVGLASRSRAVCLVADADCEENAGVAYWMQFNDTTRPQRVVQISLLSECNTNAIQ